MNKSIDTFDKVCNELGKNPDNYIVNPDWDAHEKYAMGVRRLLLIHKFFQGGKKIDFTKRSQNKWFPCFWPILDDSGRLSGFRFDGSSYTRTDAGSLLGPLLRFDNPEVSTFVGEAFLPEFNSVLMLENEL